VERDTVLGGLLNKVRRNLEGDDVQAYLDDVRNKIEQEARITVHLGATVAATEGFVGNFKTSLTDGTAIEHGAVLLTSGGAEYVPTEYGYGTSPNVMTQRELESWLAAGDPKASDRFVMIQCVGSREEPANYCSRICCQDALKNSIAIKERQPRARVVVLYRDLRAYGLKEDYYRKARDLGVLFFLYVPERKPEIIADGSGFKVRVDGKVLGGEMEIDADYLILSTGLRPREDAQQLSQTYKVTRNGDGYFMEAHVKLRPVDFPSEGLFLAAWPMPRRTSRRPSASRWPPPGGPGRCCPATT